MTRKRPCSECRRWFYPDPRVGARQRVCSKAPCQAARRKRTQASWRAANPGYFAARRITERAAAAEEARAPPPAPRMSRPLDRLPWDLAQDEFGAQGADFIAVFGRVLLRAAQDERRAQVLDTS
jgi:hypothetical protein